MYNTITCKICLIQMTLVKDNLLIIRKITIVIIILSIYLSMTILLMNN